MSILPVLLGTAGNPLVVTATTVPIVLIDDYPTGATPVVVTSGNVANASAVATMPAVSGKTNFCNGFEVTASGATLASVVIVTLAGVSGGTLSYIYSVPAGVLISGIPMLIPFQKPIPASGTNIALTLTVPALGTGNTNSSCVIHGYVMTPV